MGAILKGFVYSKIVSADREKGYPFCPTNQPLRGKTSRIERAI